MDLPGMNMHQGSIHKRPAHDMYAVDLSGVETRVHRLAESVDVLTEQVEVLTQNVQNAGTHAAAHAVAPEVEMATPWLTYARAQDMRTSARRAVLQTLFGEAEASRGALQKAITS